MTTIQPGELISAAPIGTPLPTNATDELDENWYPIGTLASSVTVTTEPDRPRDIVDEIDALVDEQMQQEPSGYDHDINQDSCPHCCRDWHGLKITARIEEMRERYHERQCSQRFGLGEEDYAESVLDPGYRYAEDDSEVLCPGSDFIGPWATSSQLQRIRNPIQPQLWPLPEPTYDPLLYGYPQRWIVGSADWEIEIDGSPVPGVRDVQFGYHPPAETIPPEEQFPPEAPYSMSAFMRFLTEHTRRIAADAAVPSVTYRAGPGLGHGDRVAYEVDGRMHDGGVIVDVDVENGAVTYTTEDPRFSARAQQLATIRDRIRRGETELPNDASPMEWFERFLTWPNPILDEELRRSRFRPFSDVAARILADEGLTLQPWQARLLDRLPVPLTQFPQPAPDTRTPQQHALPRPSHTPPMWANDPTRTRRRRNR